MQLEQDCTNMLAAALIAQPEFPDAERLPAVSPPPFCNFGHLSLIDYPQLVTTVWNVALPLVRAAKERQILIRVLPTLSAASIFGLGALFFEQASFTLFSALAFFGYFLVSYLLERKLVKDATAIRRAAIAKLLRGEPVALYSNMPFAIQERLSRLPALCGSGRLDNRGVSPVVVTYTDSHPFPGYGPLLYDTTFVCAPTKGQTAVAMDKVQAQVLSQITTACSSLNIRDVSIGKLVSIDGHSLQADSPWLSVGNAPPIWIDDSELTNAEQLDEHASVRVYTAIQLLFPRYESAATLFIRTFSAGNAVACHLAIATLGPLVAGRKYALERLQKANTDLRKRAWTRVWKRLFSWKRATLDQSWIDQLDTIFRQRAAFQRRGSPMVDALRALFKPEERFARLSHEDLEEARTDSVRWPGVYLARTNFREINSHRLTTDFFGKSEVQSTLRACYVQAVKSMLDELKASN